MSDEDSEKGDKSGGNDGTKHKSGMGQGAKDDIGVCVVIILITVLAIIVTVIKIILFDVTQYPELFGEPPVTDDPAKDVLAAVTTPAPSDSFE